MCIRSNPLCAMKKLYYSAFLILGFGFHLKASCPDFNFACPSDITISCIDDYSDLNIYGNATVTCHGETKELHTCRIETKIDACGNGTIHRYWQTEDTLWNIVSCKQIITVSNLGAFSYKDIVFPPSLEIESCDPWTDFKNINKPYDRPYWNKIWCSRPATSYSDDKFVFSESCVKIVRTWKVLDWCSYDPAFPGRGVYQGTQVIKLVTTDPNAKIICPKDTVVFADSLCEGAFVKLGIPTLASRCSIPYKIRNNSKFATQSLEDASGFYPVGEYKFYFIAETGCEHEIKCEYKVTVLPKIPPTPYCLTSVILALMPMDTDQDGTPDEGMVEVWAKDLDKGSFHVCKNRKLYFSFSADTSDRSRIFTCNEVGENEVELWITDQYGNQSHCKTKVIIQNNSGIQDCEPGSNLLTSNVVLKLSNPGLAQELELIDVQNPTVKFKLHQSGNDFQFLNVPIHNQYILKWNSAITQLSDVLDMADVQALYEIVQSKRTINTDFEKCIADLNEDQTIDMSDYYMLRSFVLQRNSFSNPYLLIPNPYQDLAYSNIYRLNSLDELGTASWYQEIKGNLVGSSSSYVHNSNSLNEENRATESISTNSCVSYLYHLNGQLISKGNFCNEREILQSQGLANGFYIVKMESELFPTKIRKIVITSKE